MLTTNITHNCIELNICCHIVPFIPQGWGLYAEQLGDELGLFEDPYTECVSLLYTLGFKHMCMREREIEREIARERQRDRERHTERLTIQF